MIFKRSQYRKIPTTSIHPPVFLPTSTPLSTYVGAHKNGRGVDGEGAGGFRQRIKLILIIALLLLLTRVFVKSKYVTGKD